VELCDLFKFLSDATRLNAVLLLHRFGELCVCDLVTVMGQGQPKISRHLAQLRTAGLLATRRSGQWIYYRVDYHYNPHLKGLLELTFAAEADRLAPMLVKVEQLRSTLEHCD
jgi:ArsR family transcriptional regulator, arsenate/arsenite/antimonite-responsive transcriptional repressor